MDRPTDLKEVAGVGIDSLQEEAEEKQLCDNCKVTDYEKATLAEHYCIKCEEKLCVSCGQEHKTKDGHLVVALNDQTETRNCQEYVLCTVHDKELAELYCSCCRKVICGGCETDCYSSHNCSRVEDVAVSVSKQAEAECENLLDIQCQLDKEREKLSNEKIKVLKTIKDMEVNIQKRCDEITEFVYNETKALLKELDLVKSERLKEFELERRKIDERSFTFTKFTEYCDKIRMNARPRYTCEAEGILPVIVDDLKSRFEGRWKSELFQIQLSTHNTDLEQVLSTLGKLTIKCPHKMTQSNAIKLDEKDLCGMAVLHEKLYLLSSSIYVRRLRYPFQSVGEIKTPEMTSQKEIVSCSKTPCLYIYDKGADCVWKISIPDHRVRRWLDKIKGPSALSITSNAELLMLRNSKPICLEVYNEHAILVRRVQLPATIPSLRSFDETPSGKYIGLGEHFVYMFRRNGTLFSQMQSSGDARYRGNPQRVTMSPYHILLQCCTQPNPLHGSISSLAIDLTGPQFLVDQPSRGIRQVGSCYLKEAKQILVLEEVVLSSNKTWNLTLYNVLPE